MNQALAITVPEQENSDLMVILPRHQKPPRYIQFVLARQCEQIFELTGSSTILELGAGSGVMAADILTDLKKRSNLPDEYLILETSADLRDRQQQRLREDHPDYF